MHRTQPSALLMVEYLGVASRVRQKALENARQGLITTAPFQLLLNVVKCLGQTKSKTLEKIGNGSLVFLLRRQILHKFPTDLKSRSPKLRSGAALQFLFE